MIYKVPIGNRGRMLGNDRRPWRVRRIGLLMFATSDNDCRIERAEERSDHLLIVEDEEMVRDVIVRQIENKSNFRVSAAASAGEALAFLEKETPDVALIDIRLPDMQGTELIRRIKEVRPHLRAIMMSGWADIQDTITALRCGAVDFFQKPLKIDDVLASIDHAFEMASAIRASRSLQPFLLEEIRTFRIPNEVSLVPHLTAEITGSLEGDPGISRDELEGIRTSIHEIVLNAIEHGNLAITYDEKSQLMQSVLGLKREIARRAADPRYRDRRVLVTFQNTPQVAIVTVADQGDGFDHSKLPDPSQLGDAPHGRGILITKIFMDEVRYNAKGNEVTLMKYKKPSGKN